MFEALLLTTSSEGLQPLGSAPQRSFELVSSTVRNRLSPAHAAIFAEPVATEHGDQIDWYAPVKGSATPLPDLDAEDQQALRDRLGQLVADIRAEAELLGQSDTVDDQRLSEALFNAIEVPDELMVQAVRGTDGTLHPVLVHWAWVRDEQQTVRGVLTAMVPRNRPAPPVAPMQAGAGRAAWISAPWWLILLGWLLLAALLGWILYLLIAPCGVVPGRAVFCPEPEPAIHAVLTEREVIEDRIARLQHELALTDRACQPTEPRAVSPAPETPIPTLPVPEPEAPEPETPELEDPEPPKDDEPAPDVTPPVDLPDEDKAELEQEIEDRGAAKGDLNFTLAWDAVDDLDLYVVCPSGQTISYRERTSCNGVYDLDANAERRTAVTNPVENVVFNEPQIGIYKVRVHLRSNRTAGEKSFTLHVLRRDGPSNSYTGKVAEGQREWTTNISISG